MRRTACWLALAVIAAPPASALPPPPPPPPARYGPLVQCLGGYAIAVAPSEAISVMRDGVSLITQDSIIGLSTEPDPYRAQRQSSEFDDPRLGRIVRYERGDGEGRRIENLLPLIESARAVILVSGVASEQAALARVSRARPGDCGSFTGPDFPGADPDALRWAPPLTPGPLFRCEGRVGYALRDDEALRMPWRMWADHASARAVLPNGHLSVSGPYRVPTDPVRGPSAAGYQASVQEDYIGKHLLLSPPRLLVRRQRPRGASGDYDIRIYFSPAGEAAARAFASRLEFVTSADPRCGEGPPG